MTTHQRPSSPGLERRRDARSLPIIDGPTLRGGRHSLGRVGALGLTVERIVGREAFCDTYYLFAKRP